MAVALLAAGCAQVAPVARVDAPAGLADAFTLTGRISVRVADRIETGKIQWSRDAGQERIELFTPFGSQVALLERGAGGEVTLTRGGEVTRSPSLAALTAEVLGVPLDMAAIARWLQGDGLEDGVAAQRALPNGEAWEVTATEFQAVAGHRHARRLTARRGDVHVRVVVDEWQPR